MATEVIYNGIKIFNAQTRLWELNVVRDPSDTDRVMVKFRLRFEGVIHAQPNQNVDGSAPTWTGAEGGTLDYDNAVDNYDSLSRKLIVDRQELEVYFGLQRSFYCVPPLSENRHNPDVDVNNGPKPRVLSLTRIVNSLLFRVAFEIECAKPYCDPETIVPDILSNRWSIAETMDENFFTTRMIRGQLRMAFGDKNQVPPMVIGHANKWVIVPPLEDGFRRERMHLDVTADGLTADYLIVDRQTDTAAPWPATKIEGSLTHSVALGGKEATLSNLHCQVRLYGTPGCQVRALMFQAMRVIDARMQTLAFGDSKSWCPTQTRITEIFGQQPIVEAEVTALDMRAGQKNVKDVAMLAPPAQFGQRLILAALGGHRYRYDESQVPYTYGTGPNGGERRPAILMILHCYLQNPCEFDHGYTPIGEQVHSVDRERAETFITMDEVDTPWIFTEPRLSDQHKEAIYTMAQMQSHYFLDNVQVQLPIARAVYASGDSPSDSDADTSAIVTLAQKQARREIIVDTERVGDWPEIPRPMETYTDGTLKGTLLKFSTKLHPPAFATDTSRRVIRVIAHYLYALNRAPREEEKLRVGVLPFTNLIRSETEFQPYMSYSDRLDP